VLATPFPTNRPPEFVSPTSPGLVLSQDWVIGLSAGGSAAFLAIIGAMVYACKMCGGLTKVAKKIGLTQESKKAVLDKKAIILESKAGIIEQKSAVLSHKSDVLVSNQSLLMGQIAYVSSIGW
jgi:hypothetical protein